ncbi:MAG TPA: hypothetical protein VKT28_10240 [Puia sp.]|nr:hypothetical protein [Puia sp.]
MAEKKKKKLTTEEKFANAEMILKGKKINPLGKELFETVLKKTVKPKK